MDAEMKKESGRDKFFHLIWASHPPEAYQQMHERGGGTKAVLKNLLFEDGELLRITLSPKRSELFRFKLSGLAEEVISTMDMLHDIPVYLARFPFSEEGISELRYLRHHVEFSLNQVYILQARLLKLFTFIERAYKHEETKRIPKYAARIKEAIHEEFTAITKVRGMHVHEQQYDQADFVRLGVIEKIAAQGWEPLVEEYFDARFREVRGKWRKDISEVLTRIEDTVDACFTGLAVLLNTGKGELLLPPNYR